ncbi:YdbL family protein [Sphingomonas bacterium]|uniref:YdbL family protein n=1 Tax=Sphingomonas bacterium TaxID=1895847 RepID=UPI0026287A66|nr:YdbL family protein [Sphingomonas bacterium]MDB5679949.1 hypothetical protein [Sphingomonas bacterium]
MMKFVATFALTAALIVAPVAAQTRDPAYQAARSAGQVGEQVDGYLGVVGNQPAAITALVNSINIQRKALYTSSSAKEGSTIQQFALTTGCNLILKTVPGEKYELPGGGWATRTAAAPTRDPRCV